AKHDGAEVIGSHVYAARLHDHRFRAMESGLPHKYQAPQKLAQQRHAHDSLIAKGLALISDSYLEGLHRLCQENDLPFDAVSREGKNWQELVNEIQSHPYDLIVLGAHGIGRVTDSQLGSVTERILRRVQRDILVCKVTADHHHADQIAVCLDGSPRSWGALQRSIRLARSFGKKLVALSVFDPHFHQAMFSTLNQVLTDKARQLFKLEQQQKLHELIIDSGLAKIYQSHLDTAREACRQQSLELETQLLAGKAYAEILAYVRKHPPWLLVLGRLGLHSGEEVDIGSHSENLCRQAHCNLLVVELKSPPPDRVSLGGSAE
ncbi:MAG: universal stress protein, partial [Acidobacteria bacterium]|nr:universal stress protein [Acidobacteriota bacterium]